jgi:hypothetical protein
MCTPYVHHVCIWFCSNLLRRLDKWRLYICTPCIYMVLSNPVYMCTPYVHRVYIWFCSTLLRRLDKWRLYICTPCIYIVLSNPVYMCTPCMWCLTVQMHNSTKVWHLCVGNLEAQNSSTSNPILLFLLYDLWKYHIIIKSQHYYNYCSNN